MRTPKAWGQPCPNPDCAYAQMLNRGNIRAVSTYLRRGHKSTGAEIHAKAALRS